jgi:CheY-like chemotaxis protein
MTTFPIPPNHVDHILVASSSSVVRQRILAGLNLGAHCVEHANGGAEALLHLEKGSWQTVFLDKRLPDLNAAPPLRKERARMGLPTYAALDSLQSCW